MNRLLRLLAVSGTFQDHGIRHLEGLMRMTWSFLDEAPIWQIEGGHGSWIDCEHAVQQSLPAAQALGQSQLTVRGATWCYELDLVALTQQNMSTGRMRRLSC